MGTPYVELHAHSCFSFLDGASTPEELVEQALSLGYEALALTDHDGLYGSMAFARYARQRGLFPITGAEVTLSDGSHLTLLAENRQGYSNLCRLLTWAHLNSPRGEPRLKEEVLWQHTRGLICLTGCRQGRLARLLDQNQRKPARDWLETLKETFGADQVFVELQQNLVYGDTTRIRQARELAAITGLPVVATNNVHYHRRERHRLQDVLVAIRHRMTLDESHHVRRPNSEFYLKSPAEMEQLFAHCPEALRHTLEIAERCRSFDLTQDLGYTFPDFSTHGHRLKSDKESIDTVPGETTTADEELARVCWRALEERYGQSEPSLRREAEARLKEELRLIAHHKLSGFFLVYRDLMQLAQEVAQEVRRGKTRGRLGLPPGRGRGSSVSSIVCYLIGLSHVDPVRSKLFLGRFLNEELQTVPDIDLDFPRDIRERLIQRVYERYGREYAALVCNFATYRLRSALRDIGMALGIPAAQLDKLSRLSEGGRASSVREELARIPELAHRLDEPPWREMIQLAEDIDGFPRHIGQHVGGMVISSKPLVEMVPVEQGGIAGRTICQWDKDSCEDAGFIKVDFLALGALGQVEECLDLIYAHRGEIVDLSTIDHNDPAVFRMIQEGDTVGVFQIESRAQIQMLPRTRPANMEDLAVQVAIVRPGPIVGGAVNPYVRRRELQRKNPRYRPPCDHPLLEPVLSETLGVIIYQDQVLQVCQAMAGFSAGKADGLRRAMSRRRTQLVMEAYWPDFRDGALARGVPEETARRVFEKVMAFSEFGFPKSHSAAFAVLAYQAAWLRRYYLPEFTAALFNNQPMGFYPLDVLVKDAQRHGLEIRPPCINHSDVACTVEDGAVRIGLSFVKQVGQGAEAIVAARRQGGPFQSLGDFLRRTRLPREAVENLIRVGAMDVFGLEERILLWQLGLYDPGDRRWFLVGSAGEEHSASGHGVKTPGTGAKKRLAAAGFAGKVNQLTLPLPLETDPVPLPAMSDWERMVADYGLMHLSVRFHPLGVLRPYIDKELMTVADLQSVRDGQTVTVAGLVVARQRPGTAKGFVFLLLEDETGLVNVVIPPDLYERCRDLVRTDPLVTVRGQLQKRDGTTNLLAGEIASLQLRRSARVTRPLFPRRGRNVGKRESGLPRDIGSIDQARLVAPPAHNFG